MLDPSLFASTPYNDRTALLDYFGLESRFHRELVRRTHELRGAVYPTYALGDGGGRAWMEAHQKEMEWAARLFEIPPPVDLSSYDLSDPVDHATFFFLSAQEHLRLMRAAQLL